jgi:hypothetical protein
MTSGREIRGGDFNVETALALCERVIARPVRMPRSYALTVISWPDVVGNLFVERSAGNPHATFVRGTEALLSELEPPLTS